MESLWDFTRSETMEVMEDREVWRLNLELLPPQRVPSLWGARGGVPPLTDACAPPFRFIQNTVFVTSLKDKTAHNDGKRNNYVQT